jgi:hypothetical protein
VFRETAARVAHRIEGPTPSTSTDRDPPSVPVRFDFFNRDTRYLPFQPLRDCRPVE